MTSESGDRAGGGGSLGRGPVRVHLGLKWTAASLVAFRFGRLLTTVILARILTEEMFGLVTLAMAFTLAFQALRDIGFGHAYVQRAALDPEEDRRAANTVFVVVAALNLAMFAVGWAIAPLAGDALPKVEGLTPVLRGVLAVLLIEAFSTTPTSMLQKRLEFGLVAKSELVGVAVNLVLSVALALAGFEEWSIVLGTLGARLCQTVAVARMARWVPRIEFDREIALGLLGFGKFLWGASLLAAANKVVDKLLLGRIAGDAALGLYGNAYNLCTTASRPLYSLVLRVAFPAMSRAKDDVAALQRGFLRAASGIAILTIPLYAGLALTARELVVTLYGSRWVEMAPLVEILATYGFAMSIAAVSGPVLMAIGSPKAMFLFGLAGQVLMLAALFTLSAYGTAGIAWAMVLSAALSEGTAYCWAATRIGLGIGAALAPLGRSALAALVMSGVVVGWQALAGDRLPPAASLAGSVVLGALGFALASRALNGADFRASLLDLRAVAGAR